MSYRRRLMIKEDEIYEPGVVFYKENVTLDGTNYIDTGIKLLSRDYDFDIDVKFTNNFTSPNTSAAYLVSLGKSDNAPASPRGVLGFDLHFQDTRVWLRFEVKGKTGDAKTYNNFNFQSVNRFQIKKRGNSYELYRDNYLMKTHTIEEYGKVKDTLLIGARREPNGAISHKYVNTVQYVKITIV